MAGFQKSLSVLLGILIIISAFSQSKYFQNWKITGFSSFFEKLKSIIGSQFKKKGMSTLFTIGILNGLLPCGFVYIGLAGSIFQESMFMALFGIGTFPAMLSRSLTPGFISLSMRKRITKISPYLAVTFGIYLIYRGIAMGFMQN